MGRRLVAGPRAAGEPERRSAVKIAAIGDLHCKTNSNGLVGRLLADAFDHCGADVVFHGHAHNGAPAGRTRGGIPVYNVSRFVRARQGEPPCLLYTLPR
jgi:hypothetical protein